MKTIQATKKPPYNEWISNIYKEVKNGHSLPKKTPQNIDLKPQNSTLDK